MQLKLIVALVGEDKTDALAAAVRQAGATGFTMVGSACGEGLEPAKTLLGLNFDAQCDPLLVAANRTPERMHVYEVMSKPVPTLLSDMLVRYAIRLLARFGLSRAIAVDQARNLLGMTTLRDLVLAEGG